MADRSGTPRPGLVRRVVTLSAAVILLALAVPFGARAGAQSAAPEGTEIPAGMPNVFSGSVESFGIRPSFPLGPVGLNVDPGLPFTKGALQASLVAGASPFSIVGQAATNDPGFVGGAVLFTDDAAVEATPGYVESFEEKPEADPSIDPHRYRRVQKCSTSPAAYSDDCDPAEPEYMLSESTRIGVPRQVNVARRGDPTTGAAFISRSDIRPEEGGRVVATVSTFVANVELPGVRIGSIRAESTTVWSFDDPAQNSTSAQCVAEDIVGLELPGDELGLPTGGGIRVIPGSDLREESPGGLGSSCIGPTVIVSLPNGDQLVFVLGAASSRAGAALTEAFVPPDTTVPVTTSPPPPAAPPPPPPAAAPPPSAPPAAPAAPPAVPPAQTGAAPPPPAPPATPPTTAAPTAAPGGDVAEGGLVAAQPVAGFLPAGGCLGMSLPACIGILTAFTGTLIAGGVYGLRYTMRVIAEPATALVTSKR